MKRPSRSVRALSLAGLLFLLGLLYPALASRLRPAPRPPSPLALGEADLRQGRFYRAERAFRQALGDTGTRARAAGRLGLLALLREDDIQAEAQLLVAAQMMPDDATVWACLGLLRARRGEQEVASSAWAESLAQPGPHFLALGLRGEEEYRQGAMAAARNDFTALLGEEAPPEWTAWAYLRLGILDVLDDPSSAVAYLQAAQEAEAGWEGEWVPSPELLYGRPVGERVHRAEELAGLLPAIATLPPAQLALAAGQVVLGQMDPAGAAWLLQEAVALAPDNVPALASLGWARFSAGQEQPGLRQLHAALIRAPRDPLVHQLLARAYVGRGWARAARHELERALELSPDDPVILLDLARAAQAAGDYGEAGRRIEEAYGKSVGTGKTPLYALLRARFYLDSGWSLCEQGKSAAEALPLFMPDAGEAWRIQGSVLVGCGRPGEAVVALEKAIGLDPPSAEGYDALGLAYLALGQREAAGQAFLEAAAREPWSRWSRHAREWLERNW